MRVAIIGTRGIPNHYGGFEQCAEYLALGLVERGHEVIVYNSHTHPYQEKQWNGIEIVHCHDLEHKIGTMGQFVYDLNCILDVRSRSVDVILQLGYTSGSVWGWLLPKKVPVTTNMDGLEWKRTKFSNNVRRFLLYAEKLGVKYSDFLISDSIGIQDYLKDKYAVDSTYIPYGAEVFENPEVNVLGEFKLAPFEYDLCIARLEPENSIEIILDGVVRANNPRKFIVIGNHNTKYGDYLKNKYSAVDRIVFLGGIYNIAKLNSIRYYSNIYFHGHTVGGTNPSLLEAMSSCSLICANDNSFNRYILEDDAFYFTNYEDVAKIINKVDKNLPENLFIVDKNIEKIKTKYTWDNIVTQYEHHLKDCISKSGFSY